MTHYILDALLAAKLPLKKLKAAVDVLAEQPATGGGQTLPSYRIPIAWEQLGLGLASALATESQ